LEVVAGLHFEWDFSASPCFLLVGYEMWAQKVFPCFETSKALEMIYPIHRVHFNLQTNPSELDQVAPASLVSSNPTPGVTAAGVAVSSSVDAVVPAEEAFAETGCLIEDDDARLTLTAFPAH
jgi:hypothetical protein